MGSLIFQVVMMGLSYMMQPKPPTIYGPRLSDLKVQSSAYGVAIPKIYGAMRVAGNVIWSTDIIETSHTTSSGGKGGPSQDSVSYTYSQSFAVAVCEGPILGIRKIWANNNLIYNVDANADNATIIATSALQPYITIYTGDNTQTANSLIQANIGTTPAYRGTAYIVFQNLQLGDYGNRTPNLEFEVVASGAFTPKIRILYSNSASAVSSYTEGIIDGNYLYKMDNGSPPKLAIYDITNPGLTVLLSTLVVTAYVTNMYMCAGYLCTLHNPAHLINIIDISNKLNPFVSRQIGTMIAPSRLGALDANYLYVTSASEFAIYNFSDGQELYHDYNSDGGGADIICYNSNQGTYLYELVVGRTPSSLNGLITRDVSNPAIQYICNRYAANWDYTYKLRVLINNNYLYISPGSTNSILIFGLSTPSNPTLVSIFQLTYSPDDICFSIDKMFISSRNSNNIYAYDITNPTNPIFLELYNVGHATPFILSKNAYIFGLYSTLLESYMYTGPLVNAGTTTLSSVVSDICTTTGLLTSDIDVSTLTDSVSGYTTTRGTARSWIEPLMQAYYFDIVESNGKIKFIKRGGASALTISEDNLAAHAVNTDMPDNLTLSRKQEVELPAEVSIQYFDKDAGYQIGNQLSQRYTVDSINKTTINLAMSLSPVKAKQIADVIMYNTWAERTVFDQQHGWKYGYLEPTDVITVTKGSTSYLMRLTEEDMANGIYTRKAVYEDSNVYTQTSSAPAMLLVSNVVLSPTIASLYLLDIPLLRDIDDGIGFYAAATSSSNWRGCQVYKSVDNAVTWYSYNSPILNQSVIGAASPTNLYTTPLNNIFDERSTVTVVLISGTLASDTEINVLNGTNTALIGNEIIQFKNATLVAANTYTLSGLLRGRKGTEWAMTTHTANERFILLTSTTTYILSAPSTEYNLERKFRGVQFGTYLDDATTISFTNTAKSKKPYAGVHLSGGRDSSGNITLKWIRRTRIGGSWADYIEAPSGESSIAFEVEIWNSTYTTLKRTITDITSATTSYTSAQQIIDFGSNQSIVYFKVFQISSTVGRGYEAKGSV